MSETETTVVENGLTLIRKVTEYGDVFYFWPNDAHYDNLHRIDGPAYISERGTEEWICNGDTHRIGGPALVFALSGVSSWYIQGRRYITNHEYQVASGLTDEEMTMMILKYGNVR